MQSTRASGCELLDHHSQRAATPGCDKRLGDGSHLLWTGKAGPLSCKNLSRHAAKTCVPGRESSADRCPISEPDNTPIERPRRIGARRMENAGLTRSPRCSLSDQSGSTWSPRRTSRTAPRLMGRKVPQRRWSPQRRSQSLSAVWRPSCSEGLTGEHLSANTWNRRQETPLHPLYRLQRPYNKNAGILIRPL